MKRALATAAVQALLRTSLALMTCAEHLARWTRANSPHPTLNDLLHEVAEEYSDLVRCEGGEA